MSLFPFAPHTLIHSVLLYMHAWNEVGGWEASFSMQNSLTVSFSFSRTISMADISAHIIMNEMKMFSLTLPYRTLTYLLTCLLFFHPTSSHFPHVYILFLSPSFFLAHFYVPSSCMHACVLDETKVVFSNSFFFFFFVRVKLFIGSHIVS